MDLMSFMNIFWTFLNVDVKVVKFVVKVEVQMIYTGINATHESLIAETKTASLSQYLFSLLLSLTNTETETSRLVYGDLLDRFLVTTVTFL